MMDKIWVVLFVALTGSHFGYSLPIGTTPRTYPHDASSGRDVSLEGWRWEYAAVPALALVLTAVGLLFGCTWCYKHKDCKQNQGTDNQIFSGSASHLRDQDASRRRSQPAPDSGFSEEGTANNNITEDNNNGPISLREMQNIANNNATAYIVSENEERNRAVSRESVVEFEPLPAALPAAAAAAAADPLERCADWFGADDFPRSSLQYLREIGRGWFGRIVEGELEGGGAAAATVAVKILNQNAPPEDKARFLDEGKLYRDLTHDHLLRYIARCLQEDPWILLFDLYTVDLHQYVTSHRGAMASLNECGTPLRLQCELTAALAYIHSHGYLYGNLWSGNVLVRGEGEGASCVLGRYADAECQHQHLPPEASRPHTTYTVSGEVWSLGVLLWEVCSWGAPPPPRPAPLPEPALPCPYRAHLYQVMQLCWSPHPECRPTAAQVHSLLDHLHTAHRQRTGLSQDDGFGSSDFEERWQTLKPNSIPKVDEHVAIVHAPSTSTAFTADLDYSRSSSIMSDKDQLSVNKSESMTNLHGSLDDVRNIYLTHNETAALECHQANISLDDSKEKDQDRSDSSVDPWLKDIMAGSQDDVSYYKDVSDVIKNLDNILNSEKTSSSESSHQASPSRDNLSLDCKKDYPQQSSLVKSPGITNFQNILDAGDDHGEEGDGTEDDVDRDTVGTLSHSFERHSDANSQHTLENLTPDTPIKDFSELDNQMEPAVSEEIKDNHIEAAVGFVIELETSQEVEAPKDKETIISSDSVVPKELKLDIIDSISEGNNEQLNILQDCQPSCDNFKETVRNDTHETVSTKSNNAISEETEIKIDKIYVDSTKDNKEINESREITKVPVPCIEKLPSENLKELRAHCENFIDQEKTFIEFTSNLHVSIKSDAKHAEELNKEEEHEIFKQEHALESNIVAVNEVKSTTKNVSDLKVLCERFIIPDTTASESPSNIHDEEVKNSTNIIYEPTREVKAVDLADFEPDDITESEKESVKTIHSTFTPKTKVMSDLGTNVEGFIEQEIVCLELPSNTNEVHKSEKTIFDIEKEIDENITLAPEKSVKSETVDSVQNKVTVNSSDLGTESENADLEFLATKPNEVNVLPEFMPLKIESPQNLESSLDKIFEFNITNGEVEHKNASSEKLNSVQNENEEILFEDKHGSEADALVDAVNENIYKSPDISSTVDILPDLIEYVDSLPEVTKENSVSGSLETHSLDTQSTLPLEKPDEIVQNKNTNEQPAISESFNETCTKTFNKDPVVKDSSTNSVLPETDETNSAICDESTVYMDLVNTDHKTVSKIDTLRDMALLGAEMYVTNNSECNINPNDTTVYMELPYILNETHNLLHSERILSDQVTTEATFDELIPTSTPKSCERVDDTLQNTKSPSKLDDLSETKQPDCDPVVTLTKSEQKFVPDNLSPFDSPTKSHPTDTYEENSSVLLGSFENCSLELFKVLKSAGNVETDVPKEELLAFSSNFSDINLETPSPLRDGNFLNEVPDIEVQDEMRLNNTSEPHSSETTEVFEDRLQNFDHPELDKPRSPSTPPNSPGNFLASTSHQKYFIDHVAAPDVGPHHDSDSGVLQKEIDLTQIELTTKLAMAENENNLNIEYSGPLTVEGLVTDESVLLRESDAIPELVLAGNGGSLLDERRETFTLDEESMAALRNELELKLPLAQVASIEPPDDIPAWSAPELVVSYPGALSPIMEETGHQLSAYENDRIWNASSRTDSSESYLEPCNNSTDEVTDLPATAPQSARTEHGTYTLSSERNSLDNNTFTIQKDVAASKDGTMSADSLNSSPARHSTDEPDEPAACLDHTYTKQDDRDPATDRISQVSPFLLSPTTDTSAPEPSDNATGIYTLSRTSVPTDAKSSKPSDTQCQSKATSIDSWCSNDTLFNVEDNFDDLALDPEGAELDRKGEENEDHSDSTDTLTHHDDDDKELSHCSTYIVHDSKSEPCDTFSPDSITANCTYAKLKSADKTSQVVSSDVNDTTTRNTQTKDLAYGSLVSSCSTELLSAPHDDAWSLQRPEMVRRSPTHVDTVNITPPALNQTKEDAKEDSPKLNSERCIKTMESVDLTCLHDNVINSSDETALEIAVAQNSDDSKDDTNKSAVPLASNTLSPNYHFKNMAQSMQSTPLVEPVADGCVEAISIEFPDVGYESTSLDLKMQVPGFQSFLHSAELRHQDLSPNLNTVESENRTDVDAISPTYQYFENNAAVRPQELSAQNVNSTTGSDSFRVFEGSVRERPQDLSSIPNVHNMSSALLKSESRDFLVSNLTNVDTDQTNVLPPTCTPEVATASNVNTLLTVSSEIASANEFSQLIDTGDCEENEQPHSIIITEVPNTSKESANVTYDSHSRVNETFDSHTHKEVNQTQANDTASSDDKTESPAINGAPESVVLAKEKPATLPDNVSSEEDKSTSQLAPEVKTLAYTTNSDVDLLNGPLIEISTNVIEGKKEIQQNGEDAKYATVNFINESFEELVESNVDGSESRNESRTETDDTSSQNDLKEEPNDNITEWKQPAADSFKQNGDVIQNGEGETDGRKITEDFLTNEKKCYQADSFIPLLTDIRFTGPASEIMSTSFSQDSPSEPTSPSERHPNGVVADIADIVREWDSDSEDSQSSGEFIWKGGDGNETSVLSSTYFDHERGGGGAVEGGGGGGGGGASDARGHGGQGEGSAGSDCSGDSGSGSEGDEVEFKPSSWDCSAAPAKSSLRSLEQAQPIPNDSNKKRVVFKRQKYHCVYEYPREAADPEREALCSPRDTLPDYTTYAEWAAAAAAAAELSYGQLYGGHPFDMTYPLRAGPVAFGTDYDDDFFISSSAHPFESLGIMSTTSQFFPGMTLKPGLAEPDEFPPPPSPLPPPPPLPATTPSLDSTTPDSGVEDITPGSVAAEDDFRTRDTEAAHAHNWRSMDSASSSESVSPSSPGGGEALGGLRHTRDKLKLDLPPSPHVPPSPRHGRVFSFVLDKPKPRQGAPLVMTDDTPLLVSPPLPLPRVTEDVPAPEPTFSTFGKGSKSTESEQKAIVLTDEPEDVDKVEGEESLKVEVVKGEGTVLDSGDEDSGIESSAKASLERNKHTRNVS